MMCIMFSLVAQNSQSTISGSGSKVTKTLNLKDFTGFSLAISGKIYLKQGNTQSVTIEAQQNIIDNILTEVKDKHWQIKFDKRVRRHDGIKIWITIPTLTKAIISGSGDIIGESAFTDLKNLQLVISGSGNTNLEVEAEQIEGTVSGSGDIILRGSAQSFTINISGSGDCKAVDLKTAHCKISISGSGDCKVYVTDTLDVKVSGSADVRYKGTPKVNSRVAGSGSVKSL